MGNSLSPSSRSIHRDVSRNSNSNSEKENRGSGGRPRFASPENRVLPFVTNGPQKLRSTDNGNILLSGGTISGRRSNLSPDTNDNSEFTQYLQKKCQSYQTSPQDVPFQTLFGHRKSHSDPDIVRKMMEENEIDDDGRYETESNPNQRSIIALSPSKAKIKSRKKKKAPEPPQPNTLPRTTTARGSSLKCENLRENGFSTSYDTSEAPRRPLPPIPLDEMPPPPPHPPPDYNATPEDREIVKITGKSFQKNRRIIDKWKFSKPNADGFAERRQRSKSLDRSEEVKPRDKELSKGFDRNYSLRRIANREESSTEDKEKSSSNNVLTDAIVEAAKKRAERLARTRMCRNLSFRSSMEHTCEDPSGTNKLCSSTEGRGPCGTSSPEEHNKYRNSLCNRMSEAYTNENGCRNGYLQLPIDNFQSLSQNEQPIVDISPDQISPGYSNKGGCFKQHKDSRSREILKEFTKEIKSPLECRNTIEKVSRGSGHLDTYPVVPVQTNGEVYLKDHQNPHPSHGLHTKDGRIQYGNNNAVQNKNESKLSYDYKREQYTREKGSESHFPERFDEHPQSNLEHTLVAASQKNNFVHTRETETQEMGNPNFRNFSRVGAMHKRSHANRRKNCDSNAKSDDKVKNPTNTSVEAGILPVLPDKRMRRNSRSQKSVIPFILNGNMSSSSTSEEEIEINLQLRPTLPRRPVDIPRFSPTDVWKSINLDFFKSHQQSSDISSEDGEDIMEEKIHRINRPVAPRRLIHDRSCDSGISPDAGSPMFLNEKFDPHIPPNTALGSSSNVVTNKEAENASWVPEHDLDDSECGSDTSPENKVNVANGTVQPKLAMPNFMFPSKSPPRSDRKSGEEETEAPEKEKVRTRDRRKKMSRSNETQHFNSLRNLKRALNIKSKTTVVDVNGLDSNWSLSRSLPNFENVDTLDDAKRETEIPEVSVLDHIRRSNSESRMMHKENDSIYAARTAKIVNPEWRKSFPGQSSDGHVMYLPEYCSYQTNTKNDKEKDHDANVDKVLSEENINDELTEKRSKLRKKFSYQSTLRQQAKKKLEEQLEREVKEKEKRRETEIEWMNIVEDEFRKQRVREKSDVRQRLRIYALQVNKKSKTSNCNDLLNCARGPDGEKCSGDDMDNFQREIHCSSNSDENGEPSYFQSAPNNCKIQKATESSPINQGYSNYLQPSPQVYDPKSGNHSKEIDPASQLIHAQNYFHPINVAEPNVLQNNAQGTKDPYISLNSTHVVSNAGFPPKTCNASEMLNGDERLINQRKRNVPNIKANTHRIPENAYIIHENTDRNTTCSAGQKKAQQDYITRSNFSTQNNIQQLNSKNICPDKESFKSSYILSGETQRLPNHPIATVVIKDQRTGLNELSNQLKFPQSYVPSFLENDTISNKLKNNETSNNSRQQPTGMKKWLRRQNRDHCHENMPRPEPEGGRSSSDDSKYMDGRRENVNPRLQPIGANLHNNNCSHGNGFHCGICNSYNSPSSGVPRNVVQVDTAERPKWSDKDRDDSEQVHRTGVNGQTENVPQEKPHLRLSVEEYELHTRLCRTNSGRTFESHSYYALERRKEDSRECESPRKKNSDDVPKTNFFSSLNFKKELKENARKKSRDFEKRARKYQTCDYDSDESGSDRKEARYHRHNVRNQKKSSQYREPSFSRNHPHRKGMKLE